MPEQERRRCRCSSRSPKPCVVSPRRRVKPRSLSVLSKPQRRRADQRPDETEKLVTINLLLPQIKGPMHEHCLHLKKPAVHLQQLVNTFLLLQLCDELLLPRIPIGLHLQDKMRESSQHLKLIIKCIKTHRK